jgi:hypothetical protein
LGSKTCKLLSLGGAFVAAYAIKSEEFRLKWRVHHCLLSQRLHTIHFTSCHPYHQTVSQTGPCVSVLAATAILHWLLDPCRRQLSFALMLFSLNSETGFQIVKIRLL